MLAAGCDRRPRECKAVVGAVSAGDREVAALEEAAGEDPAKQARALRAAARAERDTASTLDGLGVKTAPLAEKVTAYAAIARELAADADALADQLDAAPPAKAAQPDEAAADAHAEEAKQLVDAINALCAPPS